MRKVTPDFFMRNRFTQLPNGDFALMGCNVRFRISDGTEVHRMHVDRQENEIGWRPVYCAKYEQEVINLLKLL